MLELLVIDDYRTFDHGVIGDYLDRGVVGDMGFGKISERLALGLLLREGTLPHGRPPVRSSALP